MKLSVVLCTYNRASSLGNTLRSLEKLKIEPALEWELLVLDNNSGDDTRDVVARVERRGILPLRYHFEGRQGKAFALNAGVDLARGEILAFTDDDVTLHPEWLTSIVRAMEASGAIGVGGQIIPDWSSPRPRWFSDEGPYRLMTAIVQFRRGEEPYDLDEPPFGANMAFRREAFERYGGFREDLGPTGRILMRGEDTEFGRRLLAAGERIRYAPEAIVWHPVEEERLTRSYFQRFYFAYGRMEVRTAGIPSGAVRWFGVPRYLFRSLFRCAARWAAGSSVRERFYHRLQCFRTAGAIWESRRGPTAPTRARVDSCESPSS